MEGDRVTFRPNPLLIVGFAGLVLFSIQDLGDELASNEPSVGVIVLAVLAVVVFTFLSFQRVTVTSAGLDVLGLMGRHRIPWDEIAGFEERNGHPIKVTTHSDVSHALGGVNLATKQDRDRFKSIVEQRLDR